jgi:DnaK suppressor protein
MATDSNEATEARARLNAERERVGGLLSDLEKRMSEDGGISLSGDSGAETTTADSRLGLRDSLQAELAEIDSAMKRIDDGTYGLDEVTGEPINPARLEAEPTARTNV